MRLTPQAPRQRHGPPHYPTTTTRHGTVTPMLIASYELLRKVAPALAGHVDVLVCDEAHRLKAVGGNKTIDALKALGAPRIVLLTGTPLQNNLDELFAMVDIVAPGLLGTPAAFRRVWSEPIARSRLAGATPAERTLGDQRAREMADRVASVVLRRGAEVNAAFLPPLMCYDVFCRLTPLQAWGWLGGVNFGLSMTLQTAEATVKHSENSTQPTHTLNPSTPPQITMYQAALRSQAVASLLGAAAGVAQASVLPVISTLRKLCTAPALAVKRAADGAPPPPLPKDPTVPPPLEALLPPGTAAADTAHSGKLAVLDAMLRAAAATGDRVVVASTSTAVLDAVASLCAAARLVTARIDGATEAAKRQEVVDAFNRHGVGDVLLLSMRAGGAGLNLVGACKLIAVDLDWNPARERGSEQGWGVAVHVRLERRPERGREDGLGRHRTPTPRNSEGG